MVGPPHAIKSIYILSAAPSRGGGGGGLRQGVTNFYTDESPGIKVSPVSMRLTVLKLSHPDL